MTFISFVNNTYLYLILSFLMIHIELVPIMLKINVLITIQCKHTFCLIRNKNHNQLVENHPQILQCFSIPDEFPVVVFA